MSAFVEIIDLPLPPSVNQLFANAGKKGRIRTPKYNTWIEAAGWELSRQRPGCVPGRYALEIYVQADARFDLGNAEKGLSDLLVKHCIVQDDSLAWAIHIYRDTRISKGCRLVVRSIIGEEERAA